MKAEDFDDKFDRGEDVTAALDVASRYRPGENSVESTSISPPG